MKILKRINPALPGLEVGIIIYGCIIQLAGVWFVADKLRFSTGLWIGIALALGMGIHIALIIQDSVLAQGTNSRMFSAKSVLRYLIVVIIFFVMMKFHLGNLVAAFIGVMGLKVSAYVQPFMHIKLSKFLHGNTSEEDFTTVEELNEEEVKL